MHATAQPARARVASQPMCIRWQYVHAAAVLVVCRSVPVLCIWQLLASSTNPTAGRFPGLWHTLVRVLVCLLPPCARQPGMATYSTPTLLRLLFQGAVFIHDASNTVLCRMDKPLVCHTERS